MKWLAEKQKIQLKEGYELEIHPSGTVRLMADGKEIAGYQYGLLSVTADPKWNQKAHRMSNEIVEPIGKALSQMLEASDMIEEMIEKLS